MKPPTILTPGRPYESPNCQPQETRRQPARITVPSVIDYQIIKASQTSGSLADFFVQLQRPYTTIIFLGTDGTGTVTAFFTFIATGQSAGNATGTPVFLPARALQFGSLAFTPGNALCFRKPIQQFFLSFTDTSAAPANYFFMVTSDIDVYNVVSGPAL